MSIRIPMRKNLIHGATDSNIRQNRLTDARLYRSRQCLDGRLICKRWYFDKPTTSYTPKNGPSPCPRAMKFSSESVPAACAAPIYMFRMPNCRMYTIRLSPGIRSSVKSRPRASSLSSRSVNGSASRGSDGRAASVNSV